MRREYPGVKANPARPLRVTRRSSFGDIFTYIAAKGGRTIGVRAPFTEVDALILSRVAYLYLEGLSPTDFRSKVKIKDIGDTYLKLSKTDAISILQAEDVHLMQAIKGTRRFGNIAVTGYQSFFSEESVEQFAAMTLLLPDGTAYISFRGTDGSLSGWREDFDLAFLGIIPSHKRALKYAREAMDSLPKVKAFYIGGHSKGGNLASYAACKLPKRLKRSIKAVYIFDAPGFRRDVFTVLDRDSLLDRTFAYAPCQSIIGMILYSPAPYTPILSRSSLFYQHDLYNWCVQGDSLARSDFQRISYGVKRMSKDFFETMDVRHLQGCIDVLFSAIRAEKGSMRNATMDINLARMVSLVMLLRRIPAAERRTFIKVFSTVADHVRRLAEIERARLKVEKDAI